MHKTTFHRLKDEVVVKGTRKYKDNFILLMHLSYSSKWQVTDLSVIIFGLMYFVINVLNK